MNTFEFDGKKYKKSSKHQKEWGNSLISELSLRGDEEILDLGCGDGNLTEQLAQLVPNGRILGIDASVGMISAAQKRIKPNLAFMQMDINTIDFRNMFDVIFSNATLHWIKNHKHLLQNAFRALKENGVILWDFAGDGNCSHFFEVIGIKIQSKKYKKYFDGFEWPWYMPVKNDYEKIVAASGFSSYSVTEVNRDRFFANADEMIKWIDQPSIVPFISVIPDEMKIEFRDDVIKAMLEKTLQSDGTCFETFRRIHVTARK
ncbi:MAG: methyltransferase domain-containing protein [Oscillospiraceae bacterium]|nr:methyltransferase domain-containing protein [Oscillospiraceae bacterium]